MEIRSKPRPPPNVDVRFQCVLNASWVHWHIEWVNRESLYVKSVSGPGPHRLEQKLLHGFVQSARNPLTHFTPNIHLTRLHLILFLHIVLLMPQINNWCWAESVQTVTGLPVSWIMTDGWERGIFYLAVIVLIDQERSMQSHVLQNLAWCCVIMQIDDNRCFHAIWLNPVMFSHDTFSETGPTPLWSVWLTYFTPAWTKWSNQTQVGLNQTCQSGVNPKILCCSSNQINRSYSIFLHVQN